MLFLIPLKKTKSSNKTKMGGIAITLLAMNRSLIPKTISTIHRMTPVIHDHCDQVFRKFFGFIFKMKPVFNSGNVLKKRPTISPHPIKIAMYAPSWNILAMMYSLFTAQNLNTI